MKFKYKRLSSGVERPIIPITVRNPSTKQSIGYFALVDSGSDICIFASEIAELIGLDVTAGRQEMVGGVDIEVGGSPRRATVGFMPELSKNGHGLLGRDGFFDRFTF